MYLGSIVKMSLDAKPAVFALEPMPITVASLDALFFERLVIASGTDTIVHVDDERYSVFSRTIWITHGSPVCANTQHYESEQNEAVWDQSNHLELDQTVTWFRFSRNNILVASLIATTTYYVII